MAVTIQDEMWEAAKTLNERQCDAFIAALVRYAFEGTEPPKGSMIYPMFVLCKSRLDMSKRGIEQAKQDAEARRESACRAANARWAKNADAMRAHDADAMRAHDADAMQPHDPPGNAYEERGGGVRSGGDNTPPSPPEGESAKKRTKFVRPTPEQVDAYIAEMGYSGFDGEQFCAHYDSNGWKVGKAPMKDWRAAVVTWAKGRKPQRSSKPNPYEGRYDHIHMVEEVAS